MVFRRRDLGSGPRQRPGASDGGAPQSRARPENSVVEEQVDAGLRHQSREPLDQLVRLEEDRAGAVVPGPAHLQEDFPVGGLDGFEFLERLASTILPRE
jgi:hypothetical protein